jgi:hypothetical protein
VRQFTRPRDDYVAISRSEDGKGRTGGTHKLGGYFFAFSRDSNSISLGHLGFCRPHSRPTAGLFAIHPVRLGGLGHSIEANCDHKAVLAGN